MSQVTEIIKNSIEKAKQIQTLDPRNTCLALAYKDLIDKRILPKDCFDCANGKTDALCENIQFIQSRYEHILKPNQIDEGKNAPRNKSMNLNQQRVEVLACKAVEIKETKEKTKNMS